MICEFFFRIPQRKIFTKLLSQRQRRLASGKVTQAAVKSVQTLMTE